MSILPQETLEQIIDYLHDDRRALLSCSLAARNLVPVCRYHLFSEVTLVANRLCGFLELLDGPSWSSVPGAISKIIITGSMSSLSTRCQMRLAARRRSGAKTEPYIPESFEKLCAQLKNVEIVRLTDMAMAEKDVPETVWDLLFAMKAVKRLEVHRVTFESSPRFFDYVSSLKALEQLSISRVEVTTTTNFADGLGSFQQQIDSYGADTQSGDARANKIFRLSLLDLRQSSRIPIPVENHPDENIQLGASTVAGTAILRWLLAQCTIPPVHALRMNFDCERPMKNLLVQYFKRAGSCVERLWVGLPALITPTDEMVDALSCFEFGSLDQIRYLHIDGLLMSHSSVSRVLETFFSSFFNTLLSNPRASPTPTRRLSIEKITITLTIDAKGTYSFYGIPDYAVLQSFDWCSLPEIIEQALEPFRGTSSPGDDARHGVEVFLRVRSTGITGKQVEVMEESLKKESAWSRFGSGSDGLKVVFLPILERDEDGEGL